MIKHIILFLALWVMKATMAWGAPAMPGAFKVKQVDGTLLTIEQRGDEHHHWLQTPDGMLVMENNGAYCVADIDEQGQLQPTGVLAHNKEYRTLAENFYMQQQKIRANRFYERGNKLRRAAAVNENGGYLPHKGSPRVLVVLAEFPDLRFRVNNLYEAFDQYLNGDEQKNMGNYNHMNINSIRRYFEISSHGMFSPKFDLVGPVMLPENMKYYGGGSSNNERMTALAKDAIAAVPDTIDLSLYDNDNDGKIELMYVIHAGYGQNQGGADSTLWAKVSTVNTRINNQYTLTRCGCNCELFHPNENYKDYVNGIGVFCHEFSYAMGLPDIYPTNTDGRKVDNQSMEKWDVMDNGLYLRNGFAPMPYLAWEQEAMGWAEIKTLTDSKTGISMLPTLEEDGKAYKIVNPENDREFIVVENVQKRGIYNYIPSSTGGMLAYHVAYPYGIINMGDSPNNTAGKPAVAIVPSCGLMMSGYLIINGGYGGSYTRQEYTENQASLLFPGDQKTTLTDEDQLPNFVFYTSKTDGVVGCKLLNISNDKRTGLVTFDFWGKAPEMMGDVNGDTIIDIDDVVAIVNYILGEKVNNFNLGAADINGDYKIDIDDIVAIVNLILEGNP